jgi:serine protease Do
MLENRVRLLQAVCLVFLFFWTATPASAAPLQQGFADLVERLQPSVVNISTTQTVQQARIRPQDLPQLPPGSPFEEFFRQYYEQGLGNSAPRKATSLGSGFIIDETGLIVTNNHVIDGADIITVTLADKTPFKATVVGRDSKTDLALLRIKPGNKKLSAARWGDSEYARVGDWILAIGNPFGLGGSVTQGIISARARDINAGPYDDFIQVDAAINRGNSGGPLFNMEGEVIGINTAIYSPTGGNVGIGFAMPSVMARTVIEQLEKKGKVRRGWLGVKIQPVTEEMMDSLGLDAPRGALVAEVTPDSPAEAAGLKDGDVIINFGGQPIDKLRTLPRAVAETPVGKKANVVVLREGAEKTFIVTVGELPEEPQEENTKKATKENPSDDGASAAVLGMRLQPLDTALRKQWSIPSDVAGLVVTSLVQGSEAASKGIRAGNVLTAVASTSLKSTEQLREALAKARKDGRKSVLLRVYAGEAGSSFIALRLQTDTAE